MVLPYLKGFYNKVVVFLYCSSIYSDICGDYFVFSIWFLTSGIRALSLGRHCGQIFFIFADFFFGEEKRGPRHSRSFWYISVQNLQKRVVYLSSSQKNTQFKKKNRLKRSPGSQDIEVLKSANFQDFFRGRRRRFFFISVASGGRICPNKLHI
jgi:hypothetical protein